MTTQTAHTGHVAAVKLDKGYGFLVDDSDGSDVWFHCKDLVGLDFDDPTLQERRVMFDVIPTDKKRPRAFNVRPLD